MIKLTKFTGEEFYVNPELIKTVEEGGDTVLTLVSGEKILVLEKPEDLAVAFMRFKQECFSNWERALRGSES